jgi:hypothetical protein
LSGRANVAAARKLAGVAVEAVTQFEAAAFLIGWCEELCDFIDQGLGVLSHVAQA